VGYPRLAPALYREGGLDKRTEQIGETPSLFWQIVESVLATELGRLVSSRLEGVVERLNLVHRQEIICHGRWPPLLTVVKPLLENGCPVFGGRDAGRLWLAAPTHL